MDILSATILGVVQGLTEFLPVSSSGHLIFLPKIFGWEDQGLAFDVIVHLGTLVAVVAFFRKRLVQLVTGFFSREPGRASDKRLMWLLLLSIIPAGIVGFFFGDWIETTLRSTTVIAFGLIGWGIVMWIADHNSKQASVNRKPATDLDQIGWKKTLFVACAQAIALVPGTSRAGITMTAGLFAKLNRTTAAEFSFLMSIPIILLAGALKVIELVTTGLGALTLSALVAGFVASAVSGFVAIWGLMRIISKWNFTPFVVYRILVGILILGVFGF